MSGHSFRNIHIYIWERSSIGRPIIVLQELQKLTECVREIILRKFSKFILTNFKWSYLNRYDRQTNKNNTVLESKKSNFLNLIFEVLPILHIGIQNWARRS